MLTILVLMDAYRTPEQSGPLTYQKPISSLVCRLDVLDKGRLPAVNVPRGWESIAGWKREEKRGKETRRNSREGRFDEKVSTLLNT